MQIAIFSKNKKIPTDLCNAFKIIKILINEGNLHLIHNKMHINILHLNFNTNIHILHFNNIKITYQFTYISRQQIYTQDTQDTRKIDT